MTHAHRKIPQLVDGKIPKWGKLRDRQMRKVMSRTSASSVVKRLTYITHASRLSPQPFCQFLIATRRSGAAAAAGGLASATDPEWWCGINVIRALSFACLLEILLQLLLLHYFFYLLYNSVTYHYHHYCFLVTVALLTTKLCTLITSCSFVL